MIPRVNSLQNMPEIAAATKTRCLERVLFNKVVHLFQKVVFYHHTVEKNPQLPEIDC